MKDGVLCDFHPHPGVNYAADRFSLATVLAERTRLSALRRCVRRLVKGEDSVDGGSSATELGGGQQPIAASRCKTPGDVGADVGDQSSVEFSGCTTAHTTPARAVQCVLRVTSPKRRNYARLATTSWPSQIRECSYRRWKGSRRPVSRLTTA